MAIAARGGLHMHDMVAGKELYRLASADYPGGSLSFDLDGERLAGKWMSEWAGIRVWHARSGQELGRLPGYFDWPGAWTASGQLLIRADNGDTLAWDGTGGGPSRRLAVDNSLHAVAISPDSRTVAFSGYHRGGKGQERTISLHDLESGRAIAQLPSGKGYIHTLDFSPDGSMLASVGTDCTLRVLNIRTQ